MTAFPYSTCDSENCEATRQCCEVQYLNASLCCAGDGGHPLTDERVFRFVGNMEDPIHEFLDGGAHRRSHCDEETSDNDSIMELVDDDEHDEGIGPLGSEEYRRRVTDEGMQIRTRNGNEPPAWEGTVDF